jgi:hypothetical protein
MPRTCNSHLECHDDAAEQMERIDKTKFTSLDLGPFNGQRCTRHSPSNLQCVYWGRVLLLIRTNLPSVSCSLVGHRDNWFDLRSIACFDLEEGGKSAITEH